MPAQKSPFFVGPSASRTKGGPPAKTDEQIREEQRKNLSPFKRKLIDLLDRYALNPASEFAGGFLNVGPFTPKEEGEKYLQTGAGKAGALIGNGLLDVVGPGVAVAYGGGKNLPKLRQASKKMLEGINLSKMPDWFPDWATYMLERYPRTLAHNTKIKPMNARDARFAVGINNTSPIDPKLSEIGLRGDATSNTGFHELGHTVQAITEPKLEEAYDNLNDVVGYHRNPFEIEADAFAAKQDPKFEKWRDKYNPPEVTLNPEATEFQGEKIFYDRPIHKGMLRDLVMDPKYQTFLDRAHPAYDDYSYKSLELPSIFTKKYSSKPIQFPKPKTKSPFQVGPSSGNAK